MCRCCVVTYVRGPDLTAGLHFSNKAQVGKFQLGLVCVGVGISGGNLSRPPAQLESAVGPLLYLILQISLVRRDREGDLRFSEEAHPRTLLLLALQFLALFLVDTPTPTLTLAVSMLPQH